MRVRWIQVLADPQPRHEFDQFVVTGRQCCHSPMAWTRTTTDERDALMTLASFGQHDNVKVVGAWLLDGPAQAGTAG